jgi:ABC-type dipeptide/oligopeptide/nickel transport system permease component
LQYLSDNGLTLTAENLATAFDACKSKLKLSQKIQQYNGTTVVDFGESVQNPSKITSELKETISRSLATTAANIRIGWFAIPKKLPCWMNNN